MRARNPRSWNCSAVLTVAVVLALALAMVPLFGMPASAAVKVPVYAKVIGGHGSVNPSTQWVKWGHSATINMYPDLGYEVNVIVDNGSHKGVENPYVISGAHVPHLVIVDFKPARYGINASVTGGHGDVYPTRQSAGSDDAVTVDIIPDKGYRIASIVDNGVAQVITDPYVILHVQGDHNVVVSFARNTFNVNASVSGGGGAVLPATQTVNSGNSASVNITPGAGYSISTISDNGVVKPVSNPYVINNVTTDHNVVVTFATTPYTVTATVSGGNGTVSPATQNVTHGGTASIDITPDPGYHTVSIIDNGTSVPVDDPYVINNVTGNHNVVVTFSTDTYPVDAEVVGGHGTVSPGTQVVADGGTASIDITPDTGYEIASITDNGAHMAISNPYVITGVHEEHDVQVAFSMIERTVTAAVAGGNGDVDPASQAVEYGHTAAIDIVPDPGYHISSILDNLAPQPISDPYHIENVTQDHAVAVSFALNEYTVDASVSGGNGTVGPPTQNVLHGGTANISINPDGGYQVATITDNGVPVPGPFSNPYQITGIDADHTVVVTFKASDYMVAASAPGGHGTVSPATQIVTLHGDSVPIVITPGSGYHIETVTDNGAPRPAVSPYQVLDVTADHSIVVTFALDEFQVDAGVKGGHGTVAPASQTVLNGADAAINITPDEGYEIASISDNGAFMPINNPFVIYGVTQHHDVTVTFSVMEYEVTASVAGGNGDVSPASRTVDYGHAASIDIIPDPGYHVASITDTGVPVPVSDPYVIESVTSAHNVVVSFATDLYPVDASVEGPGGAVDPPTQTVADGGTASININPDAGFDIASITDNGAHVAPPFSSPYVITGVHEEHDVVVTFTPHEYTVTAAPGGAHGTVTPGTQDVYYGGTAVIDIVSDAGYHCSSIIDSGVPVPVSDPYIINNVTADHNVVATFEINDYTVDAAVAGGNGSVSPATQEVTWGGVAAVHISPDAGYHILSISDNGKFVPVESPYVLDSVKADHDVVAVFAIDQYDVKARAMGENGAVVPDDQQVTYGDTALVVLEPDNGYHASHIYDNGAPKPAANPYVIEDVKRDHTVTAAFAGDTSPAFYLAEGSTAWGFSTWICIQNPNTADLNADVTYMLSDGTVKEQQVGLPALSQVTVNPADTVGEADFSTRVECVQGKTIAVDRTMMWTGPGAPSPDIHCSVGVPAPGNVWLMPEGCSDYGFETWTLLSNPGDRDANVTITYMTEDSGPLVVETAVPAHSRATHSMLADIGAHNASIMVQSDQPLVAERSQYRNNRREGSCSVGTETPSGNFYLAEGSTVWGFTSYVLVQNPNPAAANVTLTCMTPDGPLALEPFEMPAQTRKTLRMNDLIPATDFSTVVSADRPIVAERAMYWGAGTPLGEACHCSIGLAEPHAECYLPDGRTTDGWETYTLVANPNNTAVEVMVTYMYASGSGSSYEIAKIPALSRATFNMAGLVPSGSAAIRVTSLTAGKKVLAERSMYYNNRGAGSDTVCIGSQ